jgi:hypothetical protein
VRAPHGAAIEPSGRCLGGKDFMPLPQSLRAQLRFGIHQTFRGLGRGLTLRGQLFSLELVPTPGPTTLSVGRLRAISPPLPLVLDLKWMNDLHRLIICEEYAVPV